jgi:hypothetical protein
MTALFYPFWKTNQEGFQLENTDGGRKEAKSKDNA